MLAGDGEMRGEIEAAIAALGVGAQVRITGWIGSDQVRDEILAARALVLPSFAEGLPVVIMEAMALGRPVITTYVAGIPELVRTGATGWLVPAGDVEALVAAMEACLDAGSDALARDGRCRARARRRPAMTRRRPRSRASLRGGSFARTRTPTRLKMSPLLDARRRCAACGVQR